MPNPPDNTPALEAAIQIAVFAHAGQKDKNGQPYILHPLAVMAAMQFDDEKIVAVLHDVVEDTEWTLQMLKESGFSKNILAAIAHMTKSRGEDYEHFIKRCAQNPLAAKVKIADIENNMDVKRLHLVDEPDIQRMRKYVRALVYLKHRTNPTT